MKPALLISALLTATLAQSTTKNVTEQCKTSQECQNSMGAGACCLREETATQVLYVCRNKEFIDYYFDPMNYDFKTRKWTNPEDRSETMTVYCRSTTSQTTPYEYPFQQWWLPGNSYSPILFDQVNSNIRSDMFFYPAPVMGWGDQLNKWFAAWFWFFTPLPFMVWVNNGFWWTWDWFQYDIFSNDADNTKGLRPTMYNNWFTQLFMGGATVWGPFKWYDMFTLMGFMNWFWDSLAIVFIPIWELIEAFIRSDRNNWGYMATEANNFVDRNRLFDWGNNPFVDPYDFNYWSTQENGVDCDGNVGYGYYCYCPSQGYKCSCKPNAYGTPGQKRDLCYDHYGYNCAGQFVDGEENWCQDRTSTFWYFNQQRQN